MLSYYVALHSEFRVVMSISIYRINTVFGSSLPPVVCRRKHVLFVRLYLQLFVGRMLRERKFIYINIP